MKFIYCGGVFYNIGNLISVRFSKECERISEDVVVDRIILTMASTNNIMVHSKLHHIFNGKLDIRVEIDIKGRQITKLLLKRLNDEFLEFLKEPAERVFEIRGSILPK